MLPSLGAADLVAAVPGLADVAEVEASTLATVPSAHLQPSDVLAFGRWAAGAVETSAGAVLVQGTDTIEETAYLLDLVWDRPEPLVVTGAMRPATAAGADGPANLLAAAVVAASPDARGRGVLVVLDDDVHAAARVRKRDSTALHAFASEPFGLVGRVLERRVHFVAPPSRHPSLPPPLDGAHPRVALLETHLGDRGELLRLVAGDGYDAVVVAGFGVGHLSAAMAEVVEEVATRMPVVLASRTGRGPVLRSTYGFPGSEQDLIARGALPAGWLDARKARLLVWALLAAGAGPEELRATLEERGATPGPS
ncbi:asparaginase [Nocardioides mesophilus]|uniref:asparaginase n=1 Tax=Nocardioides mesophilus TaxID=433659 RepID=UPI001CB6BDD6|nr:asparaginase [Nocardioides mesophilus]